MKVMGTISRVQRSKSGVTVIVNTDYGLRGIELERELWAEVLADFHVTQDEAVIGWAVEYNPAHGDLEVIGPVAEEEGDELAEGEAPGTPE